MEVGLAAASSEKVSVKAFVARMTDSVVSVMSSLMMKVHRIELVLLGRRSTSARPPCRGVLVGDVVRFRGNVSSNPVDTGEIVWERSVVSVSASSCLTRPGENLPSDVVDQGVRTGSNEIFWC